jgi:hypothetical protein
MDSLPLDVLVGHIWKYLSLFDIFRRAQFTCKSWNQNIHLAVDCLNLPDLTVLPGPIDPDNRLNVETHPFFKRVRPDQIHSLTIAPESDDPTFLSHFESLRHLYLDVTSMKETIDLSHPLVHLSHLETLDLYFGLKVSLTSDAFEILAPKMRSIICLGDIFEPLLETHMAKLTQLKLLDSRCSSSQLASLARGLKSLEDLSIPNSAFGESHLALPSGLKKLTLHDGRDAEEYLPDLTPCAKSLRNLFIVRLHQNDVIKFPADLQLESLSFMSEEPAACLQAIMPHIKPIQNLSIFSKSGRCVIESSLLAELPHLTKLTLCGISLALDFDFRTMTPHLKRLKMINISAGDLPGEIPKLLSKPNSELRKIQLSGFGCKKDLFIALHGNTNLKLLSIQYIPSEPADAAITASLCSLTSLESLEIFAAPSSSRSGRNNNPRLRALTADFVKNNLVPSLPCLRKMGLYGIVECKDEPPEILSMNLFRSSCQWDREPELT